jgi:glycosyltransferase involved in cell wall biosynthesis
MVLSDLLWKIPCFKKIIFGFFEIQNAIDVLHCRIDVADELFEQFQIDKKSQSYQAAFEKDEPIVSVCVGTYNRAELVVNRCIKSILNQDYQNLEVIVVGDCCTDNTEVLISEIEDKRLQFFNLPQRGCYPSNPEWRWMVAGTVPFNEALKLAKGDFITHLDDDDEYLPDRIGKLVHFIQHGRYDCVWHPFWRETQQGKWQLKSGAHFRRNEVTTSSAFYHNWLKRIPWDLNAFKYNEPGDWNRFRKFKYIGAITAHFPEPLLRHFRESNPTQT